MLQLLAQRYLQPAHAAELGQLYQQVQADPSLLTDAERTMEFSATIPAAPPTESALIQPAGDASSSRTVVTGLPAGVRPAPGGGSAPNFAPPPSGPHRVLPPQDTGTVYAPPPGTVPPPGTLPAGRESSEGAPGAFVGPFRVVRELARGGMGVVYEAERPGLDRRVALKQMLGGGSSDAVERFLIEARIAARLRHPNIVGIHDVGEVGGNPYFAMDFIEGEDLNDRIKREGPLPVAEAATLIKTLAEALAYAHERAVLHRDIKPANVLLSAEGGVPILTDFGLAKDVDQSSADSGLTQDGAIMGTPSYMPPEQAEGAQALIDRRADIYSLGATLYACLVAKPPFEGNSPMNTITRLLTEDVVPPRKLRPEIPRDLEVICLECLEKEPEARYQTSAELAADLGRYLADEPILARPPSMGERLAKWVRRNRKLTAAMVLGGLLFVAGTGGAWAYTRAQARSEGRGQAEAAWAAYEAAAPGDRDERIGLALTALQQAQRWVALSPGDPEAKAQAFQAAVALGRVAEEGQQWAFAKQAYEQAGAVDPEQVEVVRGYLAELGVKQNAELERQLQEVRGYLAAARAGDYKRNPLAYEEAEFGILRHARPEVVALLLSELQQVTERLIEVRKANLLALRTPDELESRQKQREIPHVVKAVERWEEGLRQAKPFSEARLDQESKRAILICHARWRDRLLRQGWLSEPRILDIRRGLLDRELSSELTAAQLITTSLSRMSLPVEAGPILIRYMNAEADPVRQDRAGVALCRVKTKQARSAARVFFRMFGQWTPAFEAALRGAERETPLEEELSASGKELADRLRELLHLKEFAKALALAERARQRDPDDPYLWAANTEALLRLGQLEEAQALVGRGLELHPTHPRLYLAYLLILRQRGRAKELRAALKEFDSSKFGPSDRRQIAALFDFLGELAWAESELRIAYRKDGDPETAAFLARVILRRGHPIEAIRFVESALLKDPGHPSLLLSMARAERQRGRLPQAEKLLDELLERDPNFALARYERGTVKGDRGDLGGAIEDYDAALEIESPPLERAVYLGARGVAYAKLLQADRALPDLEEAARLAPENYEVLGNLATFHAGRGRPLVALDAIDRALAQQPQDTKLLAIKGQVLARLGRKEDAAKLLSEVLEKQPDNVEARGNLAVTLIQRGRFQEAIEHLDALLKATPDNATALLNRSSARAQLGRLGPAMQDLEAAGRILPKSPRPWIGKARLKVASRDLEGGLKAVDQALLLDPRATEAHGLRGLILLQLRKVPEANAAFQLALSLDPDDVRIKLMYLNYLLALGKKAEAKASIRDILTREPGHPEAAKLKGYLRQLEGS